MAADSLFTKRKRKTVVITTSSSSDEETSLSKDPQRISDPTEVQQGTPRSSERLQKKRCKQFHKPTRDDVWKRITPSKSPGKYEQLRPRSLVNNYTKENNRYNYDPNVTSGEESMDNFIDDSISEKSSSGDDVKQCKSSKQKRIRGRHCRLLTALDDASSTDSDTETTTHGVSEDKLAIEDILSGDSAICIETSGKVNNKTGGKKQCWLAESEDEGKIKSIIVSQEGHSNSDTMDTDDSVEEDKEFKQIKTWSKKSIINSDDGANENEDVVLTRKHNRNTCIMDSDDLDDDTDDDDNDDDVILKRKHNRSIIESDDDDNNDDMHLEKFEEANRTSKDIDLLKVSESVNTNEDIVTSEIPSKTVRLGINELSENFSSSHADNPEVEISVVDDLSSECSNSQSNGSNSYENSDDSYEEESENDELESCSSRVRIQMMKKKQKREELFQKLRKERQRKLSKEN